MLTIGNTIRIFGVWMRCVILFGGEQLPDASFLKFHNIYLAICSSCHYHLFGNCHIALVIATDFGYNFWSFHFNISFISVTILGIVWPSNMPKLLAT